METIGFLLRNGGVPVYLIAIAAILFLLLGTERIFALYYGLSYKTDQAIERIRSMILSKEYTEAIQICNRMPKAPDLAVVKSAIIASENGREAMRSALGGALLEVSHRCEARLPYIALIANVATLLGLFGTITGLIKTFSAMAYADGSDKARLLGEGISEAMYSTACGLGIGIAAMVVHTLCASKSDAIVGHAQDVGFKVLTWVEQSERAKGHG